MSSAGAKLVTSLRETQKNITDRWPSATISMSSTRCLRPRSVTASGKRARLPRARVVFLTST